MPPHSVQGESAMVKEGSAKHPRKSVNLSQGAATAALLPPLRACLKGAAGGAEAPVVSLVGGPHRGRAGAGNGS